ncbi:GGDEF domain-containing protein [Bacillus sp. FJAT-42376]|uniref:diguanylate cyclase n=1 Tax=Bacillus sp. FJAT-42376 TaxID=2014076 RepID=UPI000F5169FC|nr:diguanylate cyclase [Bacillus sp. FJAT-42376]AZB41036.1 GGDEF domain-containing protein [Bacillus sp. FJAT-42376]
MIRDLTAHTAILTSFLFIAGQIFRRYPTSLNVYTKLLTGLVAGVLGSILMVLYSIPVEGGIQLDFRFFAILLAALYGGPIASLLCVFIISSSRIFFYEWSSASITACAAMLVLSICCIFLARTSFSILVKSAAMNVVSIGIVMVSYYFLVEDRETLQQVYTAILLAGLPSGFFLSFVAEYINKSNIQFHNLKNISSKDFLTGINNVRRFDELMNTNVQKALKTGKSLSILLIDLDHFKQVNDTYGHPAGDAVLQQTARILERHARNKEEVSRNGGEEFSVLLYDCSLEKAGRMAETVRQAIESEAFMLPDGTAIRLTASIGAACYPENAARPDLLFETADRGLYAAKRNGRNRVGYAEQEEFSSEKKQRTKETV